MTTPASSSHLLVPRRPTFIAIAWFACAAMLAAATSLVGLFVAPLAVPASLWVALRKTNAWSIRLPLLIGTTAFTVLLCAWVVSGADWGSTTSGGSSG